MRDPVSQRWPFHQLQHQGPRVFGCLDAVDLRDVGMVQAGEDLGFPLEPGQAIRIGGKRLRQDLQGDIAVELGISSPIDPGPCPPRR